MSKLFESDNWQTLAIPLLLLVWTSVLLAVALLAARILRKRDAVVRSAILRSGLLAVVVCPAVSAALHRFGMPGINLRTQTRARPVHTQVEGSVNAPEPMKLDQHSGREKPPQTSGAPDAGHPRPAAPQEVPSIAVVPPGSQGSAAPTIDQSASQSSWIGRPLMGLWLTVSALLLARLVIANVMIALMRGNSRPATLETRQSCESIARQMGVDPPRVLVSPGISGPRLVGWILPAILLPDDSHPTEPEIWIHELAHLKRRDCVWHLMARLTEAIIWFQPFIWLLGRAIERTAEEACDDAVVAQNGDRTSYVRRLLELAEKAQERWVMAGAGVAVVGIRSSLGRRIARLLSVTQSPSTELAWRTRAIIMLGAVVLTLGIGAIRPEARAVADERKVSGAGINDHRVRLVDANGKPVSKAEVLLVNAFSFEPQILDRTHSDSGGECVLTYAAPKQSAGRMTLVAVAAGQGVGFSKFDPAGINEIHLNPTTQITLNINGPDGKPLSGLRIFPIAFITSSHVYRMPASLNRLMSETTSAEGTVTLKNLPLGAVLELGVDEGRFANPDMTARIKLSGKDSISPPATVRLSPGSTLSGIVRFAESGQPAAGISVVAQGTNRAASHGGGGTTTNDKGEFQIRHMNAGEYNLMLHLDDEFQKEWTAAAHEWVAVKPGQNLAGLDFTLIKGGVVSGKVTKADSGLPITHTSIGAYGPAHPRSSAMVQGIEVSADGTYSLRVPPGIQYVYISGPLPMAYHQDRQDIREVKVEAGQTVQLDFQVSRRKGEAVEGVVMGVDGKPAAGITVRALIGDDAMTGFAFAKTDAKGRFEFEVLAPGTAIDVRDGELGTAKTVYAEKGKGEITLQLVRRVKLTLPGLVTDEQGKPIAGARISVAEWVGKYGTGRSGPLITDKDGRYEINNLDTDNRYSIAAEADGYGEVQSKLALNEKVRELPTLKLPRADATTGGKVVDLEGKPLAGVTVHLNMGMSAARTAVTDAEGRFSFKIVSRTQHLIWIAAKDPGAVGPHADGEAGRDDLRLVLRKDQQ